MIVRHDELPSTNDEAMRLASEGAAAFTVVVADTQSAGRGRNGRVWRSPSGVGLYASMVLRPRLPVAELPPLTLLGVILVAAATATAGPVSFVALAAPQVAWRLVGRGRPALICTALMGAVLVLAADLASQHLPWGLAMPVGLVTGLLGGVYLLVLLTRGNR